MNKSHRDFIRERAEQGRKIREETSEKNEVADIKVKESGVAEIAASLMSALMGGHAKSEDYEKRKAICEACDAVDPDGDLLFREIKGRPYCGRKRLEQITRDIKQYGCGCMLENKWRYKRTACPLGKWLTV